MPIVTRHCRQRRHEVHLSHQVDYLADDSGRIIVDFVGRFEQLSNDMAKIVDRLGLAKAELPHLNNLRAALAFSVRVMLAISLVRLWMGWV